MPNPSFGLTRTVGGAATDNPTPARNVYPTAPGGTLGAAAGGASLVTTGPTAGNEQPAGAADAAPKGVIGQPLTWWATLIVLFVVLGFVAKKAGNESEFSNLKLSAYNVLMITLAAIIGIVGLKALVAKLPIPGLSTVIAAV